MSESLLLRQVSNNALVNEIKARIAELPSSSATALYERLVQEARPQIETVLDSGDGEKPLESPKLHAFAEQYGKLPPEIRERCSWGTLLERLLADSGEKFRQAIKMHGGSRLFGIDENGSVLFKNEGVEPVIFGYNRAEELMGVPNRDPKQMDKLVRLAGYNDVQKWVSQNGYELFPFSGTSNNDYDIGDEIMQAEAHTGEPFVASRDRKERRVSWLASGSNPIRPKCVRFYPEGFFQPSDTRIHRRVRSYDTLRTNIECGAIYLLRV